VTWFVLFIVLVIDTLRSYFPVLLAMSQHSTPFNLAANLKTTGEELAEVCDVGAFTELLPPEYMGMEVSERYAWSNGVATVAIGSVVVLTLERTFRS